MSKRLLFGTLAGVTVFAAVTGSAATLGTINDGKVGASSDAVGACDTAGGVTSAYTTAWDTTLKAYEVDQVTVSGIDSACVGKTIKVTLTNASDVSLGEEILTVPALVGSATASTAALTFNADNAPAETVVNIHVSIA